MALRAGTKTSVTWLMLVYFSVLVSCKARQEREGPINIESTIAKEVKQKLTVGGKEWRNPVPDTPDSQQEGAEHFQHHCMVCHGLDGHSTGVPFAAKMDPRIPDLGSRDVQGYADGQLKWIIQNGIAPSGMPAWTGILNDNEMWNIVNYIRHLPVSGSLGVPEVYRQAQEEHAAPAPKKRAKRKHTHKHEPAPARSTLPAHQGQTQFRPAGPRSQCELAAPPADMHWVMDDAANCRAHLEPDSPGASNRVP